MESVNSFLAFKYNAVLLKINRIQVTLLKNETHIIHSIQIQLHAP